MSISIVNVPVPTSGDGPIVSVADLVGEKTIELSGTFRGKYLILGTQNGAMFVPVTLFDSDGKEDLKQTLPLAMLAVKVRSLADEAVGVAVNVSGALSVGANKFATVAQVAPGASGAQPVVDLFAVFAPDEIERDIGFMCSGGFRGAVRVLGSLDGVEFNPIGMFMADSQPSSLVSLPPVLTFSPMSTRDLVRYVKVVVDGDVTNTVTVTIGGSVVVAGGAPAVVPVATWTGCRYIFLDGDGGDDAHVGYIDAPLGTDFTGSMAQVAAVAVKTTHRVNEIRLAVGASRACVVLLKPRAGGAVYDLLTPGDGLGSEDRSGLSGYSLLHTRGSDLTNSAADKAQLGFSTARNDVAYVGPNPNGSFTVGAVTSGSGDGPEVQLLTATLDPHELLKYRARFVTAGGATIYAPVRWGATSSNAADVVTLWFIPGPPPSPGDEVWLERPGVALFTVAEAPTYAAAVGAAPASSITGMEVTKASVDAFDVGTNDDTVAQLCGVLSIYCEGRGSVVFAPVYADETGNTSGPGTTSSFIIAHTFEGESWEGNLLNTTNAFTIQAASQSGENCHLGYGTFYEAPEYFSLHSCDFEEVTLSPANMVGVNACRFCPTGSSISLTVQPRPLGGADSGSVEVSLADYCMLGRAGYLASVGDPNSYPWPAICLKSGQYTTQLDFGTGNFPETISDGLGVRVEYSDDGSQFTLVTYDSLKTTGFEVIGEQKVICKVQLPLTLVQVVVNVTQGFVNSTPLDNACTLAIQRNGWDEGELNGPIDPSIPGPITKDVSVPCDGGEVTWTIRLRPPGTEFGGLTAGAFTVTLHYNNGTTTVFAVTLAELQAYGAIGDSSDVLGHMSDASVLPWYAGDLLPCPRGTPMKILDQTSECGVYPPDSPCGLAVFGSKNSGHNQVLFAYDLVASDAVHNILGATLTNYANNIDFGDGTHGGFVLVGDDGIMVLRRTASSPVPAIGSPIFLAPEEGAPEIVGAFTTTEFFYYTSAFCLGYVLPIGDPTGTYAAVAWQPGRHYNQVRLAPDNFEVTSNTTLGDVPGLFVQLEAGLSYKIRAHLYYNAGSTPFNGGVRLALGGSATATFAWFSVVGMQEIEDSPGNPHVPKLEWVQTMGGIGDGAAQTHTGGTAGWIDIEGVIQVNTSGNLFVRFAQDTSSTGSSWIDQGSSLTAVRNF